MIVLIIILLLLLSGPVVMYVRAKRVVSIDVHALTLDEIIDIGTKASESAFRRIRGRTAAQAVPDLPNAATWTAHNGRVFTTYLAMPRTDGEGYRIGAAALQRNIFKMFSLQEMEAAHLAMPNGVSSYIGYQIGSWLGQRLWLWSYARVVLFRRWKTFSALKRADERKVAVPA